MGRKGKPIILEGVYYNNIKEASEITGYTRLSIYNAVRRGTKPSTVTYNKKDPPMNEEVYKQINFNRQHSLEEIADLLFQLGLTKTRTTRCNIKAIELRALEKIKKIFLNNFTKDEINELLGDN